MMKKSLLILILIPTLAFSQNRNEKVRELNVIVDAMNSFHYLNYNFYHDASQLAEAVDESKEKINPNYFYATKTTKTSKTHYTGIESNFRFKELTPDENNYLPSYQSEMIPFLKAKEKVVQLLNKGKFKESRTVEIGVKNYIQSVDSLFYYNNKINDYVFEKSYTTDQKFSAAKNLLKAMEKCYDQFYAAMNELYASMQTYYKSALPLNKTHLSIQNAEKELSLSIDNLNAWKIKLLEGDYTENNFFDSKVRQLNKEGKNKDSIYLYKTYGYDAGPNNGWFAHERYNTFFRVMESTIYHYATNRYDKAAYLDDIKQKYNQFAMSYKHIIDDYNDFIELADGKLMKETSSCCLGPEQYDKNENVMLRKPTLPWLFGYVDLEKNTLTETTITFEEPNDQTLINKAAPHHLIYLLDASNSMNEDHKIDLVKSTAKYVVNLQRQEDKISILSFSTVAHLLLENTACNFKKEINSKIEAIEASGSTNFDEGISLSFEIAMNHRISNGANKILLFTDGLFELSKKTIKQLKAFRNQGIDLSIIYLGNVNNAALENEFNSICKKINARFYNINATNLKTILLKEATE
jgi:hypothetical protein